MTVTKPCSDCGRTSRMEEVGRNREGWPNLQCEHIGDAIRNAAMRFGVALDLKLSRLVREVAE